MNNDKTYALTSGYPSTSFLFFSYIIKASLKETLTTDGPFEVWDALGLDFFVGGVGSKGGGVVGCVMSCGLVSS